ncbi:MAG: aminotransferase class V-fold PLP-dependent enzyme [Balneolaceae bacterium]
MTHSLSSPFSQQELQELRTLFPHIKDGKIYMNHAAIGPMPTPVYEVTRHHLDVRHSGSVENFEEGMQLITDARGHAAAYINAKTPENITFMGNTSDAISAVANGLSWNDGDEIILNRIEFPSNVYPFRRLEEHGVVIKYAPGSNHKVDPKEIEALITPKTKLVSISAVQYLGGFKADLHSIGEICKRHNIWFVVDGIQALGATPVDVQNCNIDALCSGGHKWMMSPLGSGFLYLSPRLQPALKPFKTGWLSVEEPWNLSDFEQPWLPVSAHLETGTPNLIGITGLGAALKLFRDIGTDNIRDHIFHISGMVRQLVANQKGAELLTPLPVEQRMGIVTFKAEQTRTDPETVIKELKRKSVTISAREGYFRISPHFYNTEEEAEAVINMLFKEL